MLFQVSLEHTRQPPMSVVGNNVKHILELCIKQAGDGARSQIQVCRFWTANKPTGVAGRHVVHHEMVE
jgi:hypothetical protein